MHHKMLNLRVIIKKYTIYFRFMLLLDMFCYIIFSTYSKSFKDGIVRNQGTELSKFVITIIYNVITI